MPSPDQVNWIDNDESLEAVCEKLSTCQRIGIDTEFARSRTFYAELCLIQISDGESVYLIDPFPIESLDPVFDLLARADLIKVFHSCGEDIDLLGHLSPHPIRGLFDTQIAAGMTGHSSILSYQAIVQLLLDITVEKDQTRSDWSRRPLSDAQLRYAIADVEYLLQLHDLLVEGLQQRQRQDWAEEEFRTLSGPLSVDDAVRAQFGKFNSAWKLDRRGQTCLYRLLQWRERKARKRDLPRSWIIKDAGLIQIAERKPSSAHQLEQLDAIPPKVLRRHGDDWFCIVSDVGSLNDEELISPLPKPLTAGARQVVRDIRDGIDALAGDNDIAPEMICNKKEIIDCVRHQQPTGRLSSGWRAELLAPLFDELFGPETNEETT